MNFDQLQKTVEAEIQATNQPEQIITKQDQSLPIVQEKQTQKKQEMQQKKTSNSEILKEYIKNDILNNFWKSYYKDDREQIQNILFEIKFYGKLIISTFIIILLSYSIYCAENLNIYQQYEDIILISLQTILILFIIYFRKSRFRVNQIALLNIFLRLTIIITFQCLNDELVFLSEVAIFLDIMQTNFTFMSQFLSIVFSLIYVIFNSLISQPAVNIYFSNFIICFSLIVGILLDIKLKKLIKFTLNFFNQVQKEKCLAQVVHELRNQMSAIYAYTQELIIELQKEDLKIQVILEIAQKILKINCFQQYIVNDFLDLQRLQKGTFNIMKQEFNISTITEDVIDQMKFNAKNKNTQLDFIFKLKSELIFNDLNRYQQLMNNFIGNAIKFTANGIVQIIISDYDQQSLKIEILDNGSGIQENNLKKLGQEYQTFNNSKNQNSQGVGLGLSICNQFLQKMSCLKTFLVISKQNVGTEVLILLDKVEITTQQNLDKLKIDFYNENLEEQIKNLNLLAQINQEEKQLCIQDEPISRQPINKSKQKGMKFVPIQVKSGVNINQKQKKLRKLHILVADDQIGNIKAIMIMTSLFKDIGVEIVVESVNDGIEAVQLFKNRNYTNLPDNIHIIIMDLNMNLMDGDVATREIKNLIKFFGFIDVFLIGHSSDNEQEIVDSFLKNGADMFLLKPTQAVILKDLLKNYIDKH